ncbi:hypothetical protein EW145_g6869 [Phellinidium pouzarii]|uniref:Uncharacterized protein n=1 Tax=Phellinidium pouzarii TaxID=167371 RepID=A0A4S4KSV9_9AGAM|nr:hypothetical protein EW145_g6869 [Phellinidium pouzarii]
MRLIPILIAALTIANSPAAASWWSSDKPDYSTWDKNQLQAWLSEHNIEPPQGYSQKELQDLVASNWDSARAWTQDQYARAQRVFGDMQDTAFESWDDSRLREFLLEQGVVVPTGPREKLVLAAKQHYRGHSNAASSFSSSVSSVVSTALYGVPSDQASASATSLYSAASDTVSGAAAQASETFARALDDSKDYVYSTWDQNQLRDYLVDKGVINSNQQMSREKMLEYMRDAYAKITDPIWDAYSDSYLHDWLVAHGIIKSDFEKNRDALTVQTKKYYYTPQQRAWDSWSESDMRKWLIDHNVIKSDAQIKKEKLQKLVADNYATAPDTVWEAWSDSDLRSWLVAHGYLRTEAQMTRDNLVQLVNAKYNEANARTAAYLTWPDARLRAFLRSHGMSESTLPTSRPGLLQETRIRYVQSSSRLEQIYSRLRALVASGVASAEETLGQVLELLSGVESKGANWMHDAGSYVDEKKRGAEKKAKDAKETMGKRKNEL